MSKKNPQRPVRPADVNEWAHQIGAESTAESSQEEDPPMVAPPSSAQISMFMAELGKRGGRIGGKRRLETMSSKQRTAVAKKAAKARWSKMVRAK
jgi:hypothetical protein